MNTIWDILPLGQLFWDIWWWSLHSICQSNVLFFAIVLNIFLYKLPCCKIIYIFFFKNAFFVFSFVAREFLMWNDSEFLKKVFWMYPLHSDTVNVQDVIKHSDNVNIDDNRLTVNCCKMCSRREKVVKYIIPTK